MKAKQFLTDVKKLIWHPLTILLLLLSGSSAVAQIVAYQGYHITIESKNPVADIVWIDSSPIECIVGFEHLVDFINTNSDYVFEKSKVSLTIFHNNKKIKTIELKTGIENKINTHSSEDIKLKIGDNVHLVFKLIPETQNEKYVFNIYQNKSHYYTPDPKTTTASIKPNGERIKPEKQIKQKKQKSLHNISWIGRNVFHIQDPIGREN